MGERPLIRRKESATHSAPPQIDAQASAPQQTPQQQHSLGGFQLPSQAQQPQADGDARSPFSALIRPAQGPGWRSPPQTITATHQLVARIPMAPSASATAPMGSATLPSSDSVDPTSGVHIEKTPEGITLQSNDGIGATLAYAPAIANTATPNGSEFGRAQATVTVNNINVSQDTSAHVFNVTATVNNAVTWGVHSLSRVNIANENDPAITNANYANAASDLTPDMSSDNGRPPRAQFWARDLTERHEQFHANEMANTYGQPAFAFARTWLTSQNATSSQQANDLVLQVREKVIESLVASYLPAAESRAYGDGAPLYLARATAIRNKGQRSEYH